MKTIDIVRRLAVVAVALATLFAPTAFAGSSTCFGKFPNPITDICWSCVLPLSFGSVRVARLGQEDIDNPSSPICTCPGIPPRIGLSIGFWEPARLIEVTRTPWCFPTLAGAYIDAGIDAPPGAQEARPAASGGTRGSFYQVHYFLNPVLYWLEVLLDFVCLERGSLDLAYITEVDPLWNDSDLTTLLNPEVLLFANPIAQAACAADCVAASAGFPQDPLFWCAGCNGSVYPVDGQVPAHVGGVQASSLLMQRMLFKMHRQLLAPRTWGSDALCGARLDPVMQKRGYKTQMVYPIPNTSKIDGKCCQPLGRTTILWGAGKEYPVRGEDFSYMIFRKRNCCAW
jgi:conjugal transfer pilus assembly protein TraU